MSEHDGPRIVRKDEAFARERGQSQSLEKGKLHIAQLEEAIGFVYKFGDSLARLYKPTLEVDTDAPAWSISRASFVKSNPNGSIFWPEVLKDATAPLAVDPEFHFVSTFSRQPNYNILNGIEMIIKSRKLDKPDKQEFREAKRNAKVFPTLKLNYSQGKVGSVSLSWYGNNSESLTRLTEKSELGRLVRKVNAFQSISEAKLIEFNCSSPEQASLYLKSSYTTRGGHGFGGSYSLPHEYPKDESYSFNADTGRFEKKWKKPISIAQYAACLKGTMDLLPYALQ